MSAPQVLALSLSRPWTELVLRGGKDIENRTWDTRYRGPVVIHAAQSWDDMALAVAAELGALRALDGLTRRTTPTGYLGVVDLVDVCGESAWGRSCECGPWAFAGQYHFKIARPRPFDEPIDGPGRLLLYLPPDEVLTVVDALVQVPTR